MIAFVHIPKTGGTTLVNLFKQNYKVFHKDKNHLPANITKYDICFGHFYPKVYKNYPLVTWFRHPIQRTISHYSHWKNRLTDENKNKIIVNPGSTKSFDINIGIVEFTEKIGNILLKYTESNYKQFEFIGFLETMEYSLNRFCELYDITLPPVISVKRRGTHFKVSNKNLSQLKLILKDDIDYYNEVYNAKY